MRQSLAVLAILGSGAIAADTISFFFPGGSDGVDPVATIQSVKPSTTQFHIACPTGVDSSDCGWGPGLDYTILSGTKYQASMSYGAVSMSFACDHNTQAAQMTCAVAMKGGNDDTGGKPVTGVLKGSQIAFNTATIVQGASLLSGASGAASAAPKSTPAASGRLMTDASPSATGATVIGGFASTSATGSAAPSQHTGAAAKYGIEGAALLALAGAAAVGAW